MHRKHTQKENEKKPASNKPKKLNYLSDYKPFLSFIELEPQKKRNKNEVGTAFEEIREDASEICQRM